MVIINLYRIERLEDIRYCSGKIYIEASDYYNKNIRGRLGRKTRIPELIQKKICTIQEI